MKLMQLGTETVLKYDTKITFTNKPSNLKFYANNEKTEELIVENEKYLALNGFMSLEDDKKRDIPIYWKWDFETGLSEKDKEENDITDSSFIGKVMSMQIDVKGTQIDSNQFDDTAASVTFNGEIVNYNSIQEAINAAERNKGAIVSMAKDNIEEELIIGEYQDLVLNLNSKTLNVKITNYGKVDIKGNGKIYGIIGSGVTVNNVGTMNIYNKGIIKKEIESSGDVIAIDNSGELNIYSDLEIIGLNPESGTGRGINNYGITNIFNGNISGKTFGVTNQSSGKINVYNNAIIKKGLLNTTSTKEDAIISVYGGIIDNLYTVGPGKGKFYDYR